MFRLLQNKSKSVFYIVNGIKIDFVNYNYPRLKEPKVIDTIRMADVEDAAAMKLNAIAGRGSKKDFIDIELILKKFNLQQIVDFYKLNNTKYQNLWR